MRTTLGMSNDLMTFMDAFTLIGAIALGAVVVYGFRGSSRIPPSGRDPANFEGPPAVNG